MFQKLFKYTLIGLLCLQNINCSAQENPYMGISIDGKGIDDKGTSIMNRDLLFSQIILASERTEMYLPLLKNKRIGVVTNQTGIIPNKGNIHLVDFLLSKNINVKKIFAPEHGFRGEADAGETVFDGKDVKTGLPIISLYAKNKKPKNTQINDLDLLLFDIQDVGVRFYTYISTLHYVMEAAAENNIPVIVLDRPNPNAHYIDGPVIEPEYKSFVGMHPVPIVYGMTIGEYAKMINGEKWLKNGIEADLKVIPLANYTHKMHYDLPVKPSPNLPNALSVNLYPSICFFEGTNVSEGRGTNKQFQIYGSPYIKNMNFEFTPSPNEGAKKPQYSGVLCYGEDLSKHDFVNEIKLNWLIKAYENNTKKPFFTENSGSFWIDKLSGTADLRKQIKKRWTAKQIKSTWQEGIEGFKKTRSKYLIYSD